MEVLLLIALASGGVLGYALRVYVEARQQRERERVVSALGGVPHHEQVARQLEDAAVQQAQRGLTSAAESLLAQAAAVRRGAGK